MKRKELIALLDEYEVPWKTWGTDAKGRDRIDRFCGQLRRGEVEIFFKTLPNKFDKDAGKRVIVRDVKTALIRINYDDPITGRRLSLVEYKKPKDLWIPQFKNQGSVSEKLRHNGLEPLELAYQRALLEIGLYRSLQEIAARVLRMPEKESELEESSGYPGVYQIIKLFPAALALRLEEFKRYYLERQSSVVTSVFLWNVQVALSRGDYPRVEDVVPREELADLAPAK